MNKYSAPLFAASLLYAAAAHADDYSLFNPVPDDKMRPMTTERPTKSDSINTLDSGHLQLETSLLSYTNNTDCIGSDCTQTKQWYGGGGTTLRLGLTQSAEFQVNFDAYHEVLTSDKTVGTHSDQYGFGDTTLRYKYNFWGNDGGKTALSFIASIKLPTAQNNLGNGAYEGSVELPFQWNFADTWSLAGQTQLNFLKDPNDSDYSNGYVYTLVLTKNLSPSTAMYTELYTSKTDVMPQWQNTLGFGVTYTATENWEVDTGINLGISRAADDFNWITGFSYRF